MGEFGYFELASIPSDSFNLHHLVRNMRFEFSILYDFSAMKTFLVIPLEHRHYFENLVRSVIGLEFRETESVRHAFGNAWCIVGYPSERESSVEDPFASSRMNGAHESKSVLAGFFDSFDKCDCRLLVSFIPVDMKELDYEREAHESELGKKQDITVQHGSFYSTFLFGNRSSVYSKSKVDYRETDKTQIASEIVAMCNNAKNLNDSAFRVSVIGFGSESLHMKEQLKNRLLHIEEKVRMSETLLNCLPQKMPEGEIMSGRYACKFVHFSSKCSEEKIVVKVHPLHHRSLDSGWRMGIELVHAVGNGKCLSLDYRSLNRHTSITGLQGSGKSTLAMLLCKHAIESKVPVIVITPNREWARVCAFDRKMMYVKLGSIQTNLVRCPTGVDVNSYRQELASLLSNSMDAGPYTEPLQRVLLKALRELYEKNREPDLEELYAVVNSAIESSFGIYFKNGTVKFDKYGHNLVSSLEYLRELKTSGNFASGLRIEECFTNGVVFDMGSVPKILRPLCYSLILSQIFAYANAVFDEEGENALRLLLVLEEAQLVFRNNANDSASRRVTNEIENELGSFRKRGMGLVCITHFPDQISQWIWRHMQNHFVLKQDVRGAKLAIEQLAFDMSDQRLLANAQAKLLKLGRGEACCLLTDMHRNVVGPFFMRIERVEMPTPAEEVDRRVMAHLCVEKKTDADKYAILKDEELMLKDVHRFPFSPMLKRYSRLDMYSNKGKEVKDKLVRLGLLEELNFMVGRGNYSYLVITEKGCKFLLMLGVENASFWLGKNVSFEHRLYQQLVSSFYSGQGYDCVVEQPLGEGRFADVAVYSKDRKKKMALEITLHMDSLASNARKNVDAGFDSVIVVVKNMRNEEKAREIVEELPAEVMDKVSYVLVEEFASALGNLASYEEHPLVAL